MKWEDIARLNDKPMDEMANSSGKGSKNITINVYYYEMLMPLPINVMDC